MKPEMGLWTTVLLLIGSMIGSGIFFLPAAMTQDGGSAGAVMLAFLVAGLLSLSGALIFAELSSAFPRAGGQSVYLREGLGKLPAFLYTWSAFSVIQTAAIAAIGIACAATLDGVLQSAGIGVLGAEAGLPGHATALGPLTLPKWGVSFLTVFIVAALTGLNLLGIKEGAAFNTITTAAKVLGLGFVVIVAMFAGSSDAFTDGFFAGTNWTAFALILVSALFAFDGWLQPTIVAQEIKNPTRNVPLSLLIGIVSVLAIYLAVTWAFFALLGAPGVAGSEFVAQDAAAFGIPGWATGAAILMGLAVFASTFGATNAYILTSPRIYYDESRAGAFPSSFGKLNRNRVPKWGFAYQAIWASLLALLGTFDFLVNLSIYAVYIFLILGVVSHFLIRRRRPQDLGDFKIRWWPIPSVVFLLVSTAMLLLFAIEAPGTAAFGLLLIALGVPLYLIRERQGRRSNGNGTQAPK